MSESKSKKVNAVEKVNYPEVSDEHSIFRNYPFVSYLKKKNGYEVAYVKLPENLEENRCFKVVQVNKANVNLPLLLVDGYDVPFKHVNKLVYSEKRLLKLTSSRLRYKIEEYAGRVVMIMRTEGSYCQYMVRPIPDSFITSYESAFDENYLKQMELGEEVELLSFNPNLVKSD